MSVIVKYNPNDELVPNRVERIYRSAHTPNWSKIANVLINPVIPDAEIKYLKRAGNKVVEMTQAEKYIIDQKEAEEEAQRQEEAKDITISFDKLLKAFALVVLDEVNLLRNKLGLKERTVEQLKDTVKNKYESL